MAKRALREEVIKLRLQGCTYGQIKRSLGVPKSTLSDWLRNLPLTDQQMAILIKNRQAAKDLAVERFRQTARTKLISRLSKVLETQRGKVLPLSEKELFLAGVFLYWGEGDKRRGIVAISNTDPRVIKFALYWMTYILKVPKERLCVRLHLYNDMDIAKETNFWSQALNIPTDQFKLPYIKKTTRESVTYKSFGHGTCNLICHNTTLSEKIAMTIKAISEFYGEKSELFWYN